LLGKKGKRRIFSFLGYRRKSVKQWEAGGNESLNKSP